MPGSFKARDMQASIQRHFLYECIINPYYLCIYVVIYYLSAKMHLKYYSNLQEVQTPTHHKKHTQINFRKGYFLIFFFSISVRPYPTFKKNFLFFPALQGGSQIFFFFFSILSPIYLSHGPEPFFLKGAGGQMGSFFF